MACSDSLSVLGSIRNFPIARKKVLPFTSNKGKLQWSCPLGYFDISKKVLLHQQIWFRLIIGTASLRQHDITTNFNYRQ